ncbi:FAD-linked sulfhydryl oxidase ERV1 [Vitis vinifera]|uniref:thiol oxidase n=1 Tax=Vitis vinifera TaxID=29760 RepID=A0A438BL64_VITVI|nr:FAD-linked sulfhydryl oxidase ERV1 [Vitis vinifera]
MVGASSSWSRALVQISPSTFSVIGIAIGIGVSVLGAACVEVVHQWFFSDCSLGTTLRALRYYLGGLEVNLNSTSPKPRVFLGDPWTIPVCGSLHSSSGPPMVSWDFSLGTTFRALRYYLSGLEGKSANHVSEVELGRATWTFLHTLAAQIEKYLTWIYLVILLKNGYFFCESLTEPILYKLDLKLSSHSGYVTVHNVVNRSLNKPIFPCKRVDARWGKLKCELRACYLQGTPDFGEG